MAPTTRTARPSCWLRKAREIPEVFVAEIAQRARAVPSRAFTSAFDNWHSTHSAENTELSLDIYRKLKAAGLVYTSRWSSSTTR